MGKEFNDSLGNFINDFAAGGAIRHLTDLGYTVDEIGEKLDYPIPKEKIAAAVFQHYLDTGMVMLEKPSDTMEKFHYVKEQNSFGKTSMRKIVETVEVNSSEYVERDFGKQIYKNKRIEKSSEISERMAEHLSCLPWPLQNVWVKKDLL